MVYRWFYPPIFFFLAALVFKSFNNTNLAHYNVSATIVDAGVVQFHDNYFSDAVFWRLEQIFPLGSQIKRITVPLCVECWTHLWLLYTQVCFRKLSPWSLLSGWTLVEWAWMRAKWVIIWENVFKEREWTLFLGTHDGRVELHVRCEGALEMVRKELKQLASSLFTPPTPTLLWDIYWKGEGGSGPSISYCLMNISTNNIF